MSSQDQQRLEDLHTVLVYCSELQAHGKIYVFKTGERICINQERGSIRTQDAYEKNEIPLDQVRTYKIPPQIEAKVKFTLQKIYDTGWDYLK